MRLIFIQKKKTLRIASIFCSQGWEMWDPDQIKFLMTMSLGMGLARILGWDWLGYCETYPTETVNPSLQPQTTSLMLKMWFARRSGRKYQKSWSFGHGVF